MPGTKVDCKAGNLRRKLAVVLGGWLLGAIRTLAASRPHAPRFASTLSWRLNRLEGHEPSGLIMWAPSAAIYLTVALVVAGCLLASEQKR